MVKSAFVIVALTAVVHADVTDRAVVEQTLARSVADLKDCGKRPRAVFDWAAYDAIDWKKSGKDRREFLAAERATVESVGAGLNALCSDGDYKAVLASITAIVYRPTDDRSVKLAAAIAGGTLTFTDYAFGSTRDAGDFEAAARKACDAANIPPTANPPAAPAAPRPSPAPASKPASRAWDGKYPGSSIASMRGLCIRQELTGALVVSGGRFSFPWYVDDWSDGAKPVKVGRVDGVAHADGTATTTVTFAEPVLRSTEVRTVKVKRQLDEVKSVPVTFSRDGGARRARLSADLFGGTCKVEWYIPEPKSAKTRAPARPAPSSPSPPSAPPPPPPPPPSRDDQPQRDFERRTRCLNICTTTHERCRDNRCETPKRECHERCRDNDQNDTREQCSARCEDTVSSCRRSCDDERETCRSACTDL